MWEFTESIMFSFYSERSANNSFVRCIVSKKTSVPPTSNVLMYLKTGSSDNVPDQSSNLRREDGIESSPSGVVVATTPFRILHRFFRLRSS
ncbi:hypothetical protein ABKN59_008274 [Abortiporus biennis]